MYCTQRTSFFQTSLSLPFIEVYPNICKYSHWIGLREHLQTTIDVPMKIKGVSCKKIPLNQTIENIPYFCHNHLILPSFRASPSTFHGQSPRFLCIDCQHTDHYDTHGKQYKQLNPPYSNPTKTTTEPYFPSKDAGFSFSIFSRVATIN